ncbi:hypothetical protein L596_012963 [Steinernema carpocapsae]|uniref:Ground-like domain-containing protein n=1 Tax=Steinernema carpocapsae TaxID=34508 RepID=A0A4U5NZM9_STECR|nr:hypothetical protein L596_012963 [Steinernema carpocapsae]
MERRTIKLLFNFSQENTNQDQKSVDKLPTTKMSPTTLNMPVAAEAVAVAKTTANPQASESFPNKLPAFQTTTSSSSHRRGGGDSGAGDQNEGGDGEDQPSGAQPPGPPKFGIHTPMSIGEASGGVVGSVSMVNIGDVGAAAEAAAAGGDGSGSQGASLGPGGGVGGGDAGGGGDLGQGGGDGPQYRTGPPGKKGRGKGKKGKKGKQPPGVSPPGAAGAGGAEAGKGESVLTKAKTTGFVPSGGDPHDIHKGKMGAFASAIVGKYYYAPKQDLPLPKCFHNPTGYVCCNFKLNSIMESTYKTLRKNPKFNACNVGVIATAIQKKAEMEFQTPFESIAALEDFAQKVHFSGDMVCKIEIDGKYILAYATPYHAEKAIDPEVLAGHKKIDNEDETGAVVAGEGGGASKFLAHSMFV